jgi:hypothetical protein
LVGWITDFLLKHRDRAEAGSRSPRHRSVAVP